MSNQLIISKIEAILDQTDLTSSAYRMQLGSEQPSSGFLISIFFKDNNSYYCKICETSSLADGENLYRLEMAPGLFQAQEHQHTTPTKLPRMLTEWSNRIKESLIFDNAFYAEYTTFKERLEKWVNEHCNDDKRHFEEGEKESWKARFRDLEAKYQQLFEQQEITELELKAVRETLNTVIKNIDELPKKQWYRGSMTQIYRLVKTAITSPTGKKLIEKGFEKGIDNLLGPPS